MAKIKTIMSDHRYPELLRHYQKDFISFAAIVVDKKPTWQQRQIIEEMQKKG